MELYSSEGPFVDLMNLNGQKIERVSVEDLKECAEHLELRIDECMSTRKKARKCENWEIYNSVTRRLTMFQDHASCIGSELEKRERSSRS